MPDVSLAALALRLTVSMAVVLVLMFLAAKLLRRAQAYAAGSAGGRGGRTVRTPIEIGAVTALNRGASVALVRACGREMVLGVTEQQVTLLHSSIETIDPAGADTGRSVTRIDPDAMTSSDPASAARIAALVPTSDPLGTAGGDGGPSAWTDALELLRARTVRR